MNIIHPEDLKSCFSRLWTALEVWKPGMNEVWSKSWTCILLVIEYGFRRGPAIVRHSTIVSHVSHQWNLGKIPLTRLTHFSPAFTQTATSSIYENRTILFIERVSDGLWQKCVIPLLFPWQYTILIFSFPLGPRWEEQAPPLMISVSANEHFLAHIFLPSESRDDCRINNDSHSFLSCTRRFSETLRVNPSWKSEDQFGDASPFHQYSKYKFTKILPSQVFTCVFW